MSCNNYFQELPVRSDDEGDDEEIDEEDNNLTQAVWGTGYNLVYKFRTIIRILRTQPVKNDNVLQLFFIKEHGKELKLIPDCKTMWLRLCVLRVSLSHTCKTCATHKPYLRTKLFIIRFCRTLHLKVMDDYVASRRL